MKRSSRRSRKAQQTQDMEKVVLSNQISLKSKEELRGELFTIVSFEYAMVDHGKYYPCELGAIQFSLAGGILDAYHTFISPKPLPPGSFGEAKIHAEESHQIPLLGDFQWWDDDWNGISGRLSSMIGSSFCIFSKNSGNDLKVTAGCLDYLARRSAGNVGPVPVLPIEQLVQCISQRFGVFPTWSTDEIAKYLQRPKNDFAPKIRCFYHEYELDSHCCAYATVFRLFFNLVDYMNEKQVIPFDSRMLEVPERFVQRYQLAESLFQERSTVSKSEQVDFSSGIVGWPQQNLVKPKTVANEFIGQEALGVSGGGGEGDDWDAGIAEMGDPSDVTDLPYGDGDLSSGIPSEELRSLSISGNTGDPVLANSAPQGTATVQQKVVIRSLPKTVFGIRVEPLTEPLIYIFRQQE